MFVNSFLLVLLLCDIGHWLQMADAMEMMILSILGPALHCDWMVPPWQQALLTTVSIR